MDNRTPQQLIEDVKTATLRLGDARRVHWMPGVCKAPNCKQDHNGPGTCDSAMNNGDWQPFPHRPTVSDVVAAIQTDRADAAEAINALLKLVTGQQRQLDAVSAKHANHRHKVGEGHFSDRAE